ncbi:MAG: Rrf2 family transcriptional regulator [Pseudomonadota bacterium]
MHMTLRSNHAMRLLMYCAVNDGRVAPVSDIARACNMSEAHLGKIANALAAGGFVQTLRGRRGGVRLARAPEDLNVGEIIRATELGYCLVECLAAEGNTCPLTEVCKFRSVMSEALEAFLRVLDRYTLADLVNEPGPLRAAMSLEVPAKAPEFA